MRQIHPVRIAGRCRVKLPPPNTLPGEVPIPAQVYHQTSLDIVAQGWSLLGRRRQGFVLSVEYSFWSFFVGSGSDYRTRQS
jgi:hypothetical protein